MKNKAIFGIIALALIATAGVGSVAAFGGHGYMGDLTEEQKAEMEEQHEAMKTAIENEDYETWKSLMEERIAEMQESLTEENFNSIVERHTEMVEMREQFREARESGDFEGPGFHKGMGFGECMGQ